jgi:hypothetical protein
MLRTRAQATPGTGPEPGLDVPRAGSPAAVQRPDVGFVAVSVEVGVTLTASHPVGAIHASGGILLGVEMLEQQLHGMSSPRSIHAM